MASLPTSWTLRLRLLALTGVVAVGATALMVLYLNRLLELTPPQWRYFWVLVAVALVMLTVAVAGINERLYAPILRALTAQHAGETPDHRAAFAAVVDLPRRTFVTHQIWWPLGGAFVAGGLALEFDDFRALTAAILIVAATSGGVLAMTIHFFLVKRLLRPVRLALAPLAGTVHERRQMIRRVPVVWKLWVTITGVTMVPLVYSAFFTQMRASEPVERVVCEQQLALLAALTQNSLTDESLATSRQTARTLGIANDILLLAPDSQPGDALKPGELDYIRRSTLPNGTGLGYASDNVFAWQRLEDGRTLVALKPWSTLASSFTEMRWTAIAMVLLAALISIVMALLIARDIGVSTRLLATEFERVAGGDLRPGAVLESEDELGDLGHTFARMEEALRSTVADMTSTAGRVDEAARNVHDMGQTVTSVTGEQTLVIRSALAAMHSTHEQIGGIARSAELLAGTTNASAAAVDELGQTSVMLRGTSSELSTQVDTVSTSIEEMNLNVRQVAQSTDELADATDQTAGAMDRMATSLHNVDRTGAEMAQLAESVIATAERGRLQVAATIDGINAIRDASDASEHIILSLGDKTEAIGTILDVIDEVATRTNLLALNASIIAAQAGESGRAFAVVADEIKVLATRVLSSTSEIAGLITAVQSESANAIAAATRGSKSISDGTERALEAGHLLDDIKQASVEAAERVHHIATSVQEQASSAAAVAALTGRVNGNVDRIRTATRELAHGNDLLLGGAVTMRKLSDRVHQAVASQARGSVQIGESAALVKDASDRIMSALREQTSSCREAADLMEDVHERNRAHEATTRRMDDAAETLQIQARGLRKNVERFRV